MLKNFKFLQKDAPVVFYDDVYLIDDTGRVFASRAKSLNKLKNIFSIVHPDDIEFIRENMFFSGLKSMLLVRSEIGPIFIDCSLFASYGLFIAIAPHFLTDEILTLTKEKLLQRVKLCEAIKRELDNLSIVALNDDHTAFSQSILEMHKGELYYRTHGRTNAELTVMMSEIAHAYGSYFGCDLNVRTVGLREFDISNELSVKSFIFALISLCILARNYSASRSARLDLIFDERAISFEFGFPLAEEYRGLVLSKEAQELAYFMRNAEMKFFECIYAQDERAFAVRGFPVLRSPHSSDLKERKPQMMYND